MSFVRLGDIATSRKGKKPSSLKDSQSGSHNIPYIDIKAFEKHRIENYSDGNNTVLCKEGDLVIVWDGSRSGLVGRALDGALGSTLAKITSDQATVAYLYYFLMGKYRELNTRPKGTGTPHIDPNILWNFNLYLPHEAEQEKIVAKVEELLSDLNSGLKAARTARKQLLVYRQALMNSLFSEHENTSLGSLVDDVRYGTSKKCGTDNSLTPVLRIPNIVNGYINTQHLKYAAFDSKETEKLALRVGDLLVIRSNGSPSIVGRCADVTQKNEGLLFAGYLIRLRFNPDEHSAEFYKYILSSPRLREQIQAKAKSTSGVNNINSEEIKSLVVPKLSLQEQQEVVKILGEKVDEIKTLEMAINEAETKLAILQQSVLQKAYSGELL